MTDNEQLDETEGKELSGYAKQRAKFKEELDARDKTIADLRAEIKANKVAYFKNTLSSNGYKGDFDEFANKYADNLGLDEMVSLYVGMNGGAPVQQAIQEGSAGESTVESQQPTIGPKSIIGQNPIGEQQKSIQDMSIDELKARGRQHPEIFQQ